MMKSKIALALLALVFASLTLHSCKASELATGVAADTGVITESQKGSIDRSVEAVRRSQEDLTEAEEYSIGRAVAADLIARYGLVDNPILTTYVNRVGRAVVISSSRPEIYAGYHFAVLNSDQVNAFATPGGFIFVTKGLLRLVSDEDALANVLAHEVAHVANRDGLAAINKNRLLEAFSVVGNEAGRTLNQSELLQLTKLYDGAVGDVVKTLIETGYSRDTESRADQDAVHFASGIGYQPEAMLTFFDRLGAASEQDKAGLFSTHPQAAERKAAVTPTVDSLAGSGTVSDERTARFRDALATL